MFLHINYRSGPNIFNYPCGDVFNNKRTIFYNNIEMLSKCSKKFSSTYKTKDSVVVARRNRK